MRRILSVALLIVLMLPWSHIDAAAQSELKLWVVEASSESREKPHFDAGLDAIKSVLSPLPHDTYRKVTTGTHALAAKGPTRITLTNTYTLEAASPVSATDGRIRLRLRILMKESEAPFKEIEALSTELLLRPDKQVMVRGLKLKDGKELILVLALPGS